jgi:predicted RND superfamily exporter protein
MKPRNYYLILKVLIEDLKKSLISPDENFVKMEAVETMSATKEASRDEQLVIKQGRTDVTNKEVRETIKRIEETEKKKEAPSDIDATRPASKEEIEAAFYHVEYVDAGIPDEIGFITVKMTEADFARKLESVSDVRQTLRLAD